MVTRRKVKKGGVETRGERLLRIRRERAEDLEFLRRGDTARRTRESAINIAKAMGTEKDVRRLQGELGVRDEDPMSPKIGSVATSDPGSTGSARRRKRTKRRTRK